VSVHVSRLHFDISRIKILACRKGWHTSSVTKEGGWNRKIRRAIEPAMHAPINARHVRAHGSRTFSGGAPIAR
jgi:hypothetical protein